ncbi:MAG: preprotein translocase subunit YajC [Chloroflexota bacterium]
MRKIVLLVALLLGILALAVGCVPPPQGTEPQQGFDWTIIVFLVLIFAVFYFLMIRPQRKRQQQQQTMTKELQKGDKVITAGGIFGTIDSIREDSVVLKIEGGTTIRIAKSSVIGQQQPPEAGTTGR